MTYREFNIEHNGWAFIYSHKEYDGPEDKRCGSAKTIEEAKEYINEYYEERTPYKVALNDRVYPFDSEVKAVGFVVLWDAIPLFKISFNSL